MLPNLLAALIAQDLPVAEAGASVAVTTVENRMTVPVLVDGAGPFGFVIDTGAERTVIARELAARLALPPAGEAGLLTMSGPGRVPMVRIASLMLSDVADGGAVRAPALAAADLGGKGLLGIDTLRAHRVTIDFDAETMAVAPARRRVRAERAAADEIVVRARSQVGQLIVTDAEVNGRTVRVVLDTGSAVSIGNSALRRLLRVTPGQLAPMTVTSVLGQAVELGYMTTDRIRLGSALLTGMPVAFADVPPFERFGLVRRPALLLGMDALRMFRRVDIDFPNRELRLRIPRDARTEIRRH